MDPKSAQTIEALEAFIQRQRSLLEHTRSDITRLHELRTEAAGGSLSTLTQPMLGLTHLCDAQLSLPPDIDWSLFKAHDPTPLKTLTLQIQQTHARRNQPSQTQHSPLSDLQLLVKNAQRTLLDPVLSLFECMSDLSDDDDEAAQTVDPAEARRERERQKLRELKQRKIRTTCGGLGLPQVGVYIRRDVEDESAEVDVTLDGEEEGDEEVRYRPVSTRMRKPSYKVQSRTAPSWKRKPDKDDADRDRDDDLCISPACTTAKPLKHSRGNPGKSKSDTYKQAWSVSEQHLLEQLLEQIPDGEKNRWQKISRGMDGKRTPRQVASRVQKYFEKLKKFGVGVG